MWDDPTRAQELGRERSSLEIVVATIDALDAGASDAADLLDMAVEEDDQETVDVVTADIAGLITQLEQLE